MINQTVANFHLLDIQLTSQKSLMSTYHNCVFRSQLQIEKLVIECVIRQISVNSCFIPSRRIFIENEKMGKHSIDFIWTLPTQWDWFFCPVCYFEVFRCRRFCLGQKGDCFISNLNLLQKSRNKNKYQDLQSHSRAIPRRNGRCTYSLDWKLLLWRLLDKWDLIKVLIVASRLEEICMIRYAFLGSALEILLSLNLRKILYFE